MVIKAVAVFLMFFHHLFAQPDRLAPDISYIPLFYIGAEAAETYIGRFGKICVALFLFLGGYGTYLSCAKKIELDLDKRVFSKIKKLYFVYWDVFLLFIPMCFLFGASTVNGGVEQLLWNFSGLNISYNWEWWFFTPYVLLMIAFPSVLYISCKFKSFFSEFLFVCFTDAFVEFILPVLSELPLFVDVSQSLFYGLFVKTMLQLPAFWMGILFAKNRLLDSVKEKHCDLVYSVVGVMLSAFLVYMRDKVGASFDFIMAPCFTVSITLALNNRLGSYVKRALIPVGKESTVCWLSHSFFCYYLCQEFVYFPRYTVLIVLLLLAMCLITGKVIKWVHSGIQWMKIRMTEAN